MVSFNGADHYAADAIEVVRGSSVCMGQRWNTHERE